MIRIAILFLLALPSVLVAEARTVEITSTDGFRLVGTLRQNDRVDPGVLLLHQCNADRTMYDDLGDKLAAAGFRVLAIDFRGFGASIDDSFDLAKSPTEDDWQRARARFPEDVEAAYQYLVAQGDGTVMSAVGASCGGGEQIALAAAHPQIKRLAFLSSGLSQIQIRDALKLRSPSLLLITAKGDMRAAQAAGTLAYRYGKTRTELILYDGDSHGAPLFAEHPDLADRIVAFLVEGLE